MKIKGLNLYQPWATLLATGQKRIETRSWSTQYRGPMAMLDLVLPTHLVDPPAPECVFGDYGEGRFAWYFKHARPIAFAPYVGALGLFNVAIDAGLLTAFLEDCHEP